MKYTDETLRGTVGVLVMDALGRSSAGDPAVCAAEAGWFARPMSCGSVCSGWYVGLRVDGRRAGVSGQVRAGQNLTVGPTVATCDRPT